ncbi:MAG: shikimate kinase [Candidatus Lokiarchaeota archaeon]|nr:shikimate kinase [Candidatus Harpocratesius repetitus]
MKSNISLIGFRYAGKTTLGRALAKKFHLNFIDIDDEIIKTAGLSISKIFKQRGERYFRDLEEQVINRVYNSEENAIISPGGGAILSSINRTIIQQNSFTIYLNVKKSILIDRYCQFLYQEDEYRPKLSQLTLKDEASLLLQQRQKCYMDVADIVIPLNNSLIVQNLSIIIEKLLEFGPSWLKKRINSIEE